MIKGVSLFANVGIAEFYLKEVGIDIIVGNELLQKRCDLHNFFHPNTKMICGDITKDEIYNEILEDALINKCDFLLATPPCQGMSVAGKMQEDDPRNSLIIKAIKFIKDLEPNYAIIENVPTFFDTNIIFNGEKIKIKEYLKKELEEKYNLNMSVLDVSDYSTPQTRKRAIVLISNKNIGIWDFPEKKQKITVRDAISHLPSLENAETSKIKYHYAKNHSKNHVLWMTHTPTGKTAFENEKYFPQKENGERIKGFSTTYKRIDWDKPAPTITMCNGAISSQNNVHPGRLLDDGTYSDPRVLSLKEIFILTGLPDDIEIPNWASDNFIRQVIGEGVPPKLIKELILKMPKSNIQKDYKTYELKLNYLIKENKSFVKQNSLFVNI